MPYISYESSILYCFFMLCGACVFCGGVTACQLYVSVGFSCHLHVILPRFISSESSESEKGVHFVSVTLF